MSLLTYEDLILMVEAGVVDAKPENINGSSIDITLGNEIFTEKTNEPKIIDISKGANIDFNKNYVEDYDGFYLRPGQFILAHSRETFNLPSTISAEYKLKSSMARNGTDHLNAGWCDPWWHGSNLTLELKNVSECNTILLRPGMKIGQIVFFKGAHVPRENSYAKKGRYNGDQGVSGSKGGVQ